MNQKNLSKHPALICAQDIAQLCKPLSHLGITYFAYVNVDINKRFAAISNHPTFHAHYINSEYYNDDINMSELDLGNYVLWDVIEKTGRSAKLYEESIAHGIDHTFTIIEKTSKSSDYFHFASNKRENSINQIYLTNISALEIFAYQFKSRVMNNKSLRPTLDQRFETNQSLGKFSINHKVSDILFDDIIQNSVGLTKGNIKLSAREIEVLEWLHKGKRTNEIASILNIAEITVNKHITNIKEKSNCRTLFQLGELSEKIFCRK